MSEVRRSDALLQSCQPLTCLSCLGLCNRYGSIQPLLVDVIISKCKLQADHRFIDIGSGIGQVVLQIAACVGAQSVVRARCRVLDEAVRGFIPEILTLALPSGH